MSDLDQRFEQAAEDVKKLTRRPDNDTLLDLYGLYKQGAVGDVRGKRPGIFDPVGRAKWDAWKKRAGMDRNEAKEAYIELVEKLIAST